MTIFLAARPLALAAALSFCASAGAGRADAAEITDAAGRTVAVEDVGKVVSVGGSVTEILYALGLENRIIAVDTTSLHPPRALAEKPNVGYMRALSPEGLLSTGPSLILAEEGSGPPEAIALLESSSVPFVLVPSQADAEGVADKIRFVARAMGVAKAGEEMADAVAADLAAVREATSHLGERAKALFVLSLANGRIMAAGEGTSAAAMIEMAGAENALQGFSGYKPVNDEAVLEAQPDVIVMMARGDHAATIQEVLSHPALSRTPAAADKRVIAMDGLYLLGFGPRIANAVHDLAAAIYPDAELPAVADHPWTANAGAANPGAANPGAANPGAANQ